MRQVQQIPFGLPNVSRTCAPIGFRIIEIRQLVRRDFPRFIDIRFVVAPGEIPERPENGGSSMETLVTGACDRPPLFVFAINENDVVEAIAAFKTHHQRRIAVIFQQGRREERCFEAVNCFSFQCGFRRTQGRSVFFAIIGKRAQEILNLSWCAVFSRERGRFSRHEKILKQTRRD